MTACHPTPCRPVRLIFGGVATKDKPPLSGFIKTPHRRRWLSWNQIALPDMETPGAFDRSIRFSVPTH
jgi:hypothetical protein